MNPTLTRLGYVISSVRLTTIQNKESTPRAAGCWTHRTLLLYPLIIYISYFSSQCREWERQRRNKFNDAITKLGEIVKAISKASEPLGKETDIGKTSDNVKYAKIEILQKAIICLTNITQEKTQLSKCEEEVTRILVYLIAVFSG